MSAPWNPEGNPVHFLIELHDVLRGGFDRFLTVNSKKENLVAEQRQALETVRLAVHNPINYGVGRDALISETMAFLRNKAIETSSEFDPVKVRHLIKDEMINALMGLSNVPPVHLSDSLAKSRTVDERKELISQLNSQSELMSAALGARQGLLRLLGDLGCAAPREIAIRSTSGEAGHYRFRDLQPVAPTYRGEEMPSSKGAIGNFEQDY